MLARLDDRAVIAVTGADSRNFLQGLVTNDVEKLAPGAALYAALLTPQGKVLFDFLLTEGEGAILIDCARVSREALAKRLQMYRLRAKVAVEPRDQLAVFAAWDDAPLRHAVSFFDPRVRALGQRAIGAIAEMPADTAPADTYHARRLALGIPEAADFGSDRMFALDADLEELHAVNFDKGCYVGQELTARMKHRATARKRLLPVETADGSPLPASDTSVTTGIRDVGEIISSYGTRGFALIRLDRLDGAGDAPLKAGDVMLRLKRPEWLFP